MNKSEYMTSGSLSFCIESSDIWMTLISRAACHLTEVLKRAFDGVELDESITDECVLVERLGHPISIVEGSPRNIKITTREDLLLAESLVTLDD